eukprot:TRINITY_DN8886_c0_g1_i13.p1 TRINITY_DN8886_c0_g1~~TRINITY_DN8886_c0_g1_i13.p1  ORF type:complete len:269 (-),score=33.21 TRINITY_DN8886_c0_g1_i13:18-824(-)
MKRKEPEASKDDDCNYEKGEKFGNGTYGKVYLGRDKRTNRTVAIKKIRSCFTAGGVAPTMFREIAALKRLRHPYIIQYARCLHHYRLLDTVFIRRNVHLVMEYLPYDLSSYLKIKTEITESERKTLFFRIVTAVEYIHENFILHRDLKPKNILITSEGTPKIADFGLSRSYQLPLGNYTHEIQSLYYRAPEILLGSAQYSTGVDVWSLGCILYEIFAGKVLFRGDSEIGQLYSIFQVLGTPNEESWAEVDKLRAVSYTHLTLPTTPYV